MTRFIFLAALVISGLTSCTQSDVSKLSDQQKTDRLEGSWIITLFEEDNGAKVHDFSDYSFDFAKDGSFKATVSGQTYNGTWDFGKDDGLERIYITITGTSKLDELTDDWVLDKLENKSMTWKDDNAASGERVEWQKS